jgi:hypothetical protein
LIILHNFSTLLIKGNRCIVASKWITDQWHKGVGTHFTHQIQALACHYQRFEQLPPEKRGGKGCHSLFNDEGVQGAARAYLTALCIGDVTPMKFWHTLNNQILPMLRYVLDIRLSECTAQCWLYKLGWQQTRLKKGIYMDGHERDDVKEY